jgi:hypothetical protein
VARQLALRTVVAWFGNLSFDQQKEALGKIQDEHEQSRSAKKAELETRMADAALYHSKPRGGGRFSFFSGQESDPRL